MKYLKLFEMFMEDDYLDHITKSKETEKIKLSKAWLTNGDIIYNIFDKKIPAPICNNIYFVIDKKDKNLLILCGEKIYKDEFVRKLDKYEIPYEKGEYNDIIKISINEFEITNSKTNEELTFFSGPGIDDEVGIDILEYLKDIKETGNPWKRNIEDINTLHHIPSTMNKEVKMNRNGFQMKYSFLYNNHNVIVLIYSKTILHYQLYLDGEKMEINPKIVFKIYNLLNNNIDKYKKSFKTKLKLMQNK